MRNRSPGALRQLEALAEKQRGLVTHAQATSAGLSRTALSRQVTGGNWQRVFRRVFRRTGSPESPEQRLLATCFWLGAEAVASHRTAAALWGLNLGSERLEISTPARSRRPTPGLLVHRARVPAEDRRTLRGIPLTSGARTLIDLATCLDEEALAFAVEEAWRKQICAPDWLERRLGSLGPQGRPGAELLRQLLADCRRRETPLESALEVLLWRSLLRSKLRPLPIPGYPFCDRYGQPGRIDFAFPGQQLALEAEGFEFHREREAFERDRVRASRLAALGWRVLPVTWRQMKEQPAKVLERIGRALTYRTERHLREGRGELL